MLSKNFHQHAGATAPWCWRKVCWWDTMLMNMYEIDWWYFHQHTEKFSPTYIGKIVVLIKIKRAEKRRWTFFRGWNLRRVIENHRAVTFSYFYEIGTILIQTRLSYDWNDVRRHHKRSAEIVEGSSWMILWNWICRLAVYICFIDSLPVILFHYYNIWNMIWSVWNGYFSKGVKSTMEF